MSDDLALETRRALPDALRVLFEDYPREAWEADPNFSELIRFWLDRHLMFRRLMEAMRTDARTAAEGGMAERDYAARLSRLGSMFASQLHGHHQIEDAHYFPHLIGLDQRLSRGFEILDRDHHAIDGHLAAFADAANGILGAVQRGQEAGDPIKGFDTTLAGLEGFLHRHLTDEEEIIVPVLLRHAPAGLV